MFLVLSYFIIILQLFYRSDWELFDAAVMFTLEEDGQMITLSHKKVSDKGITVIQILENLQEDYQTFREEQHKDKVSAEEIEEAFKKYKEKRDAIHEFEVELTDNQIEKLKDEFVLKIVELDMRLEEAQEKIATLNKIAEVIIKLKSNNIESMRLAKYELAQLRVPDDISVKQVNENLVQYREYFNNIIDKYDQHVGKLEQFRKLVAGRKDNMGVVEL
ncbi:lantibiotic (srt) production protein [Streptococcus uberis]|uniref:helical hairpin domain-containing protein n=1 Tax=Streptococcus uberis TaxID=1349 RepID=UPI0027DE5779|nr:helical hairpin domain-containing protein [Streptococcus uberis]MCK1168300.1 lantibiotic (srt) production protein [Streptococcus uberis]MCK1243001.1 lantibiotic (srt) production protein [Streptococcus uberis]